MRGLGCTSVPLRWGANVRISGTVVGNGHPPA